jgi:hypothetical protein
LRVKLIRLALGVSFTVIAFIACAKAADSAPSDPGAGGSDGVGGGVGTSGGDGGSVHASQSSMMSGLCAKEDCAALDDVCNVGACVNGECQRVPAQDGTPCDDGKYCTENDACKAGKCESGSEETFCPSPDDCHVGACDEGNKSCGKKPGNDGFACDDGDPCTKDGVCNDGSCSKGEPIDCSAFSGECTIGVCNAALGCHSEPKNDGTPCYDGVFCTENDVCSGGVCKGVPKMNGTPCDDGAYCTVGDVCSGGACQGVPKTCGMPSDVCRIGTCDEAGNTCVFVPGNDGKPCDDGNACTVSETCSAGVCKGGVPGNVGQACDDGDACTVGTTCSSGVCTNALSTNTQCVDGDQCCPAGCDINVDKDCIYWKSGVVENVAPAELVGWSQCYSDTYNIDMQPFVSDILQKCNKPKLLLACGKVGNPVYQLVAMAPRADVLYECGQAKDCKKESNGVGWYYSDTFSWGFAPAGAAVYRNPQDLAFAETFPELRLSWSTFGGGGFRCGDNSQEPPVGSWLINGVGWERVVYHAD